ncbi:nicotinate-nucleotide adenylyltransferase [Teredinibacter sp. KSP-S5-2]|uniref:nicotinate-nucleotide adenylyltransferase n=1 Tax=Teredinibacter sp. KSP-S5-2 TaxID=3034506 RepID=UPI0029341EAE|nr:nicotinate-nucleotide adenylyltransferase [Teredinibacter sp. KSP-S5-2]WNO09502.1 nicotinate-nucleotide adenylyltransferase [Teredinibacter sp. KSP-S5-2]
MIAILGGSFDPVHNGHLSLAADAVQQVDAQQLRFVPCHVPPHKESLWATNEQRVAMLHLALGEYNGIGHAEVDTRELEKTDVSYTVETLEQLRHELGQGQPLVFILGWDSFRALPNWYRWQELLSLTNIAVAGRPGIKQDQLPAEIERLQEKMVKPDQLHYSPCGYIAALETRPVDVSSTTIRTLLKKRDSRARDLMPKSVYGYIQEHQLYL